MNERLITECPECGGRFDTKAGHCLDCGVRGAITGGEINPEMLAGLLDNVRMLLLEITPGHFRQMVALFSPRAGKGDDDAIPFTDATCDLVHRFLIANGILCARIDLEANRKTNQSLVLAVDEAGIERGVRQARKFASRARARFSVRKEIGDPTPLDQMAMGGSNTSNVNNNPPVAAKH